MRFSLALSLTLLAPCLMAQGSIVSPSHFTTSEGAGANSIPFGINSSPYRYLQVHDDLQGTARALKGITFRRDATMVANTAYSNTVDIWCSTAVTTSTTASVTFDLNHGPDKTQVVVNKTFNFPATRTGSVPTDFTFDTAFDAAWPFPAAGPLCLEIQKTAHTNVNTYYINATSGAAATTNPPLSFVSYGTGCRLAGAAANMTATGGTAMNWPLGNGILRVNGANGPANSAVIVFLGGSNTSAFGIPLPFLLPGSATAPSGPCNLYASMVLIQGAATTATGTSATTFAFPATPDLNGIRTFEQIMALDPAANPSGVVLSNGVNHDIVAPYGPIPGARVYLPNSLGPTGIVNTNFLLVTRFNL